MDVHGKDPINKTGEYFRASVWSWRPIAEIILAVNEKYKLGFPDEFLRSIHYNNGAGLLTQEDCNTLANFMEVYIEENFKDWDTIGIDTGWYQYMTLNERGDSHLVTVPDEVAIKLRLEISSTCGIFVRNGQFDVMSPKGVFTYHVSHSTDKEHLQEFIDFLRSCGGFEIY